MTKHDFLHLAPPDRTVVLFDELEQLRRLVEALQPSPAPITPPRGRRR